MRPPFHCGSPPPRGESARIIRFAPNAKIPAGVSLAGIFAGASLCRGIARFLQR